MRATRRRGMWAAAAAALSLAGCRHSGPPVDLLRAGDRLVEAGAATHDRAAVLEALGRPIRINDVVRRTLPAGPPGRLVFRVDVPRGARLSFAYAIAPEFEERPGVEFVVTARRNGRGDTIFSKLLDPLSHPDHRGWQAADVDLAKHAGREVELRFE